MQIINSNESRALRARGLTARWAVLAIGLSAAAWSGEALAWTGQPLAYVTSFASNSISVIDTGANTVVDTIPVGNGPEGIAVAPDGKHVYVAISTDNDLSVIDATTDKVVKKIPVAGGAFLAAVTPDGKHAYVTGRSSVWVIDTTSEKVVATVPNIGGGEGINGIAVTPDGKRVYVTSPGEISAINTTSNKVVATIPSVSPRISIRNITIAPDGKHAYATNTDGAAVGCFISIIDTAANTVTFGAELAPGSTILAVNIAVTPNGKTLYLPIFTGPPVGDIFAVETATNAVAATIPFPQNPLTDATDVAITPDGRRAYVTAEPFNAGPSFVTVVDVATNLIISQIAIPKGTAIAIIPPPQGVQFPSFNAKLDIQAAKRGAFDLQSEFTLSSTASNGIHPDREPVKLQVGPFITTIPAGAFRRSKNGSYTYEGVIDGVRLEAQMEPTGTLRYTFDAEAKGANLGGTTNPVQVSLSVGDDAGLTEVKAYFDRYRQAFGD